MLQQERNIVYEAVPPAQETQPAPDTRDYSSTYTVISKVAYLIGVPKKFFEAEYAPPQLQTFDQMEREKNARIIRDLCRLRTAIEQNYGRINKAFLYDLKNLHTLPEYIPQECLRRLSEDGIELLRANYKLTQYIIDINLHIANRINNCRDLLPLWLKWEYVRELFLMPNGTKETGLKRAAEEYCANRTHYPYQVYINWPAQEERGTSSTTTRNSSRSSTRCTRTIRRPQQGLRRGQRREGGHLPVPRGQPTHGYRRRLRKQRPL